MKIQPLTVQAKLQVAKPAEEVFEAIVDPDKMKNYFISSGSARMEEGKEIIWMFPEMDEKAPIRVGKMEQNKLVSFYWEIDGKEHLTEIQLEPTKNNSTIIAITEAGGFNDEAGIQWLKTNTEGWANFLACLKAFLEYGINLRKGGFDFMRND